MSEKAEPKQGIPSQDIDPIAFDDEKVFGLDPAVHWVYFRGQREQFPEIVGDIVKHWDNIDWLTKLLERMGYNIGMYGPENNPAGIFLYKPESPKALSHYKGGFVQLRYFLLRAAGIKLEIIHSVFHVDAATGAGNRSRSVNSVIKMEHLKDIATRRKEMIENKK